MLYVGNKFTLSAYSLDTIRVVKVKPKKVVKVKPKKIRAKRTAAKVTVLLQAPGQIVSGPVSVRTGGTTYTRHLSAGKASISVAKFSSPGLKKPLCARPATGTTNRSAR